MYVKLRDQGTIFHDATQDATVTGSEPKKVKATPKVQDALKKGILIKVDEKDLPEKKAQKTAPEPESDTEVTLAELKGMKRATLDELGKALELDVDSYPNIDSIAEAIFEAQNAPE